MEAWGTEREQDCCSREAVEPGGHLKPSHLTGRLRYDSVPLWRVATAAFFYEILSALPPRPRSTVGSDTLPSAEPKPDIVRNGHRSRKRTGYSYNTHLLPWCRAATRHPGHPCAPALGSRVHSEEDWRRSPSTVRSVRYRFGKRRIEVARSFWPPSQTIADAPLMPEAIWRDRGFSKFSGAGRESRTPDLLITNQLLYH